MTRRGLAGAGCSGEIVAFARWTTTGQHVGTGSSGEMVVSRDGRRPGDLWAHAALGRYLDGCDSRIEQKVVARLAPLPLGLKCAATNLYWLPPPPRGWRACNDKLATWVFWMTAMRRAVPTRCLVFKHTQSWLMTPRSSRVVLPCPGSSRVIDRGQACEKFPHYDTVMQWRLTNSNAISSLGKVNNWACYKTWPVMNYSYTIDIETSNL